jgi:hypothetical protein
MLIRRFHILVLFSFVLFGATSANADPPRLISYQGFARNANGQPVNGAVSMTVRLYADAQNGAALWQETQPGVNVVNGIFSIQLGTQTALDLPFDAPYFLSVQIDGEAEMSPRQPLGSVPYAFRALTPTGPPGPPGPAGPSSIANCPGGMTKIELATSTICYYAGTGSGGTWDQSSQFCYDSFRAPLCSAQQWRFAVCQGGLPNPGRSWIGTITGTGTFATLAGCTGESAGSAFYSNQFAGPCCLEWMKY